jgi:uncharacterized membrane-anchored protein
MKHIKSILILLNLAALLFYFHYYVNYKEQIIDDGQIILLNLAPVDPRSLMQGDYMSLRYALARKINKDELELERGFCVVELDTNGVAQFLRVQKNSNDIEPNEHIIEFYGTGRNLSIGANSYFFEEGQAEKFEEAEYGGIKVDKKGNSVLIGLYNEHFDKIE